MRAAGEAENAPKDCSKRPSTRPQPVEQARTGFRGGRVTVFHDSVLSAPGSFSALRPRSSKAQKYSKTMGQGQRQRAHEDDSTPMKTVLPLRVVPDIALPAIRKPNSWASPTHSTGLAFNSFCANAT